VQFLDTSYISSTFQLLSGINSSATTQLPWQYVRHLGQSFPSPCSRLLHVEVETARLEKHGGLLWTTNKATSYI
jgi:hypothetical protein